MHPKPSVAAIRALKGQRQVLMMHTDTAAEAAAAADAGTESEKRSLSFELNKISRRLKQLSGYIPK